MGEWGKILIFAGLVLLSAGFFMYLAGDKASWIGNLPGDIRKESGNVKIYFPITTMILLTIVINVLLRIFRSITSS